MYAECGLIIYLFRRWRPRTLIPVGVAFLAWSCRSSLAFAAGFDFLEVRRRRRRPRKRPASTPTRFQAWIYHDMWKPKILPAIDPNAPKKKEEFEKSIKASTAAGTPGS